MRPMLIAQISDFHLKPEGVLAYHVAETASALRLAVEHINHLQPMPDAVLITGDLEQAALERLVDYYQDTDRLDVDLYHVGHHGAANATTEALVGATTPEIAVISMGDPDYKTGTKSAYAYGHPRDKIITMISSAMSGQRLPQLTAKAAIGAKKFKNILVAKPILGTGWDGTVIVRMASDGEIAVASAKVPVR